MFSLLGQVSVTAGRRAAAAWPVALSLVVYAVILYGAGVLLAPFGLAGGFVLGFVLAACWSSYLELISQAVAGSKIRIRWDDFRKTFGARLWDVVSVMFAFWIIGLVTDPLQKGPNGPAITAILAIAVAFFFNAVPELLYQGRSRSFALLMDSARFMLANPVVWLLPNVVFAAIALGAVGALDVSHPAELLVLFGAIFSSPMVLASIFIGRVPLWGWPLLLAALHYVMVFRGILFAELSSGAANPRMRAFKAQLRP
jgi:hypothetical protein